MSESQPASKDIFIFGYREKVQHFDFSSDFSDSANIREDREWQGHVFSEYVYPLRAKSNRCEKQFLLYK